MASPSTTDPPLPPVKLDPLAALLSYLIPGLGQIYQGRVRKGLVFFGGLYLLFFYGMWMGQWRNVWLPDASELPEVTFLGQPLNGTPKSLWYRPQFLGQFWIGTAAWPAVYQHLTFDATKDEGPVFGTFMRSPPEGTANDPPERVTLNKLQREGNKRWDLGWVYTVIAGVLNLLVIYDAFAGPMFRDPARSSEHEDEENTKATAATASQAKAQIVQPTPAVPVAPPSQQASAAPVVPPAQQPAPSAPPPAPQEGGV
jgi:hypothetical protein